MHEDPQIPNYGPAGRGPKLSPGMVFAIEPMITAGTWEVRNGDDGWAIYTADGTLASHCEHTVAITANGPRVLTLREPAAQGGGGMIEFPFAHRGVFACVRPRTPRVARPLKESVAVKVRPSVKPMCEKCRIIRRHGNVLVICTNPRHKQRQG